MSSRRFVQSTVQTAKSSWRDPMIIVACVAVGAGCVYLIDSKIAATEAKVETKISALETKMDTRITALETKMDVNFASLRDKLDLLVKPALSVEDRVRVLELNEARNRTGPDHSAKESLQ